MPRRPARARHLRGVLLRGLLAILSALFAALSWRGAQRVGRRLGALAWSVAGRDRRRTLDHLAIAFPEIPEPERRRLGRASFLHHGTTLAECLQLFHRDCAHVRRVVEVKGWEEVERVRAAGKPVLILSGHCGNWELLAAAINCHGLGMSVVARRLDEPGFQTLLAGLRERFGTETIERGGEGAARKLLTALRKTGALGMLIDQDTKVEGVWVPFFGRPAFTPVGAAKIALSRGAAVVPAFVERLEGGRHRATFHPPLDLPEDPTEATAVMTAAIEAQIRKRPEQWVWMHRRWRRQPVG